jgi:hypothetical protein
MIIRRTIVAGLTFLFGILILPSFGTLSGNQVEKPQAVLHRPNAGKAVKRGRYISPSFTSVDNGQSCTTITFEGVGDLSPIPEFDGITSPGWLGLIDFDAGGSGNFAFEPSPETVAFWLGGDSGSRDIAFTSPAAKVEFLYASAVTVQIQAFDESGNFLTSAVGPPNFNQGPGGDPTGDFNKWDPLGVMVTGNKISRIRVFGNVNQTGIDNLKVCRSISIHSVEVTQAIQEWQTLDELKADLQNDHEPPVPIVKGKPAVLRVYFDQIQATTNLRVELSGVSNQTRSVTLQPQCTPESYRRAERGCQSVDFYFVPPSGQWQATIKVFDDQNGLIETQNLPFSSRDADSLVLRSVSICDAKDNNGNWLCAQGDQLASKIDFLQRTAPTDSVRVSTTNHVVRRDLATYTDPDPANSWWTDSVRDVHNLFSFYDLILQLFGERRYYYGLIRPALPGGIGGMAHGIPSRGAGGRSSIIRLGVETVQEVIAHETGHMLGRKHTNRSGPVATGNSPPGCYSTASDPSTDWPFADNRIQSSRRLEVGFDVATRRPVIPETTFDWMGYCTPRWVSPHTYRNAMLALGATSAGSVAHARSNTTGPFWTVSGKILNGQAALDPLFVATTQGPDDAGSGTHRIEVRASNGSVLFTRFFIPDSPATESGGNELLGPPVFFELVPVIGNAQRIVVFDSNDTQIGNIQLGGSAPVVNITFPIQGVTLSGVQTIIWTIVDPDSTSHRVKVLYSADGGTNWVSLGEESQASFLRVNFDTLPGSSGTSRLMISASDGVNTGSSVSSTFSVTKKTPTAQIVSPLADTVFRSQDLVWLRAQAYDVDEDFLDGKAIRWESNLDGVLGFGSALPITSLTPGDHQIVMTATDSDKNSVSRSVRVTVAGAPPTMTLTVTPLDVLPTTCVEVTIAAQAGSVALGTAEYSFDGGQSWIAVPLNQLPFRFLVPGQGFFHLVARVFDSAGQVAAKDSRFFIDSACNGNLPPVANAGPDQVIECQGGQTNVVLNGSLSTDPNGDPLTYAWHEGQTLLGNGPILNIGLPLGSHVIALTVADPGGASSQDMVTVNIVDTHAPAILCPGDRTEVTAKPGDTVREVGYSVPNATDSCSPVTVACTPAPGSVFPVGTTSVTCVARDTAGNTNACSFAVIVFDVRLEDDAGRVLIFMSQGGQKGSYRFCCGNPLSGVGTVSVKGSTFTLTHTPSDRRVQAVCDATQNKGTASLQFPPGNTVCTIQDRDTRNNSHVCP